MEQVGLGAGAVAGAGHLALVHSPYCYKKEMTLALERHRANRARVVPVILRPTDFKGAPFEKLQTLPKDARPKSSAPATC